MPTTWQGKGWNSSEGNSVGQGCKKAIWGMVLDVREDLGLRAGNGGNECPLSSYFCVLMWAKLVCLLAHPLEDQKQAGACHHWKLVHVYSNSKMVTVSHMTCLMSIKQKCIKTKDFNSNICPMQEYHLRNSKWKSRRAHPVAFQVLPIHMYHCFLQSEYNAVTLANW